eukprot:CAMPEP_0172636980 /NCGR_PEP_ID=MMETSP1068-20121228/206614_1 /TAXON_ID=35684 /ORGANISM="Pseudopedinella elastica, Strain CCMP716" /LENGTH=139 /DNA_ID=CAMNT_0013449525 /DNA_START=89 /DNA_END=508 /DNA_ORIENTATION=+
MAKSGEDFPSEVNSETRGKDGPRHCRCPLCGEVIVAKSQEECVEHMSSCAAFNGVHPGDGQPTNFDYFKQGNATAGSANSCQGAAENSQRNMTAEEIAQLNIRELKRLIESKGLSHNDCLEKADLLERAREALSQSASP